jgi:hypothetical protein
MILVIIFTLAALTIIGAIIYGVQKRKKNVPLAVVPTTVPQAEIQQLVTKLKEKSKTESAPKPVKVSGKPKMSATKVTKTK